MRVASRNIDVGAPNIRYRTLLQYYVRGVGEAGVRNVRGMRKGTRMVKWCNVLSIHRLDLERLALRNALLLPDKEPVQQKQEVVQVASPARVHTPNPLSVV